MLITSLLINVFIFLSCIVLTTLSGLGALKLLRAGDHPHRILIAPALTLGVSAISSSLTVIAGIPLHVTAIAFWVVWVSLALLGTSEVTSAWRALVPKTAVLTSIGATLVTVMGYILIGYDNYVGSPALDGWSYISFAEYLLQYPRGTEGGLSPLFQYASHLSNTRFAASALVATLVPPWGSSFDAQMSAGVILTIAVYSYACAIGFASITFREKFVPISITLSIFLGVVGGWLSFALEMNNFDNILAIVFSPLLFAIAYDKILRPASRVALTSIFVAACVYIYPELSLLLIFAYGVVVIESLVQAKSGGSLHRSFVRLLATYVLVACLSLLLISPYVLDAVAFFVNQLSSTSTVGGRPGEGVIPEILDYRSIPGAFWGLGAAEYGSVIVGIILFQLFSLGMVSFWTKRSFAVFGYLVVIMSLFGYMVVSKKYDYGAYKVLLVGWWAFAIALASGVAVGWQSQFSAKLAKPKELMRYFVITVVGMASILWIGHHVMRIHNYSYKETSSIRELRSLLIELAAPVQISVSDSTSNAWLVYHLRDLPVFFSSFSGYMAQPHVVPIMSRSAMHDVTNTLYLLTDISAEAGGPTVWQSQGLKLVKSDPEDRPVQFSIDAPNGRESVNGRPFFWLGLEPAHIAVAKYSSGSLQIDFSLVAGPSIDPDAEEYPRLVVTSGQGERHELSLGMESSPSLAFNMPQGSNRISFELEYSGGIVPNHNSDPRVLLVGVNVIGITSGD